MMPSRGVKINHIYYWCEAFRDPEVQGETVPVRYDPFDAGTAYAFVRKQWLQCHSEYYAVAEGPFGAGDHAGHARTAPAPPELIPPSFTVTARQLAEFLQSVEAEEKLLTQRLT